jgi:hypothetical protein
LRNAVLPRPSSCTSLIWGRAVVEPKRDARTPGAAWLSRSRRLVIVLGAGATSVLLVLVM